MPEQTMEQSVSALEKEIAELKAQVSVRPEVNGVQTTFQIGKPIDIQVIIKSINRLHRRLPLQFGP